MSMLIKPIVFVVSVSELLHSVIVHNGIYGLCTESLSSLTLKTATAA